jgi:hypothetical protein
VCEDPFFAFESLSYGQHKIHDQCVRSEVFTALTMKNYEVEREKWVVVRDTTGGGNRIYHRF